MNTKNLQGEIDGLDQEIAMLQDCLYNTRTNLVVDVDASGIDRSQFIQDTQPNTDSKSQDL